MYDWIETTFNVSDGIGQAIAVIVALAVVLLLFALFIFIIKRLMGAQNTQNRSRQPRIAVMDSAAVDTRRRLVLIRRDNIEHLLLVGGPSDVVVEQNIVRHAPLQQSRSGDNPVVGAAAMRMPLAPGPEIPPRPDDLAAQVEAAPPPAVQARPPSQEMPAAAAPRPAPQAPEPTVPAAPARFAPETQPPAPRPAAAKTGGDPSPGLQSAPSGRPAAPAVSTSSPTAPAVSAQPAATPTGTAQSGTVPVSASQVRAPALAGSAAGAGLNRAADLLRAATQNGFSRAGLRDRPDTGSTRDAQPATTAPAVRPAAKTSDTAPDEGGKAGSALKSLTRPFSPQRASYGSHSITPPASGPAARARTALTKPHDAADTQARTEPVLESTVKPVQTDPDKSGTASSPGAGPAPVTLSAGLSGSVGAIASAPAPAKAEPGAPDTPDAGTVTATEAAQAAQSEKKTEAAASVDKAGEAGAASGVAAAGKTDAAATATAASDASDNGGGTGAAREIAVDLSGLLEDLPAAPSDAPAAVETTGTASKADTPAQATSDTETPDAATISTETGTGSDTGSGAGPDAPNAGAGEAPPETTQGETQNDDQTGAKAGTLKDNQQAQTTSAGPTKAPAAPSSGLGDRNPIEEEMAKLLDELGGQANG